MNPINHDAGGRLYCGPAVVASITAQPTSVIIPRLKVLHPWPDDLGVSIEVIQQVCAEFGYSLTLLDYSGKLVNLKPYALSIVGSGQGHYVLTHNGEFVDCKARTPSTIEAEGFSDTDVIRCWEIRAPA